MQMVMMSMAKTEDQVLFRSSIAKTMPEDDGHDRYGEEEDENDGHGEDGEHDDGGEDDSEDHGEDGENDSSFIWCNRRI